MSTTTLSGISALAPGAPSVSVLIRFCNEIRYLDAVLRAVRAQSYPGQVEILAVDNESTDGSRQVADRYADRVLSISGYRPGRALNESVAACTGDYLVPLSAHALPASRLWLTTLVAHLRNPDAIGVYGAQVYPQYSKFLDKRDLDIFSDTRPRTECRDSDFWNANSAFPRRCWHERQFDETVIELEDHLWTKELLPGDGSRWVRFEPDAIVYHYGHDVRNDRQFVPEGGRPSEVLIDEALSAISARDAPWSVRMSAGLTLSSLNAAPGIARAVRPIGELLLTDPDFDVRWRMAGALGRIAATDAVPYLIAGLKDSSFYPQDECAWSLARLGAQSVQPLLTALSGLDVCHMPFAALALGMSGVRDGEQAALQLIVDCLRSCDQVVERDALYFLGEMPVGTAARGMVGEVLARTTDSSDRTVRSAVWCWGKLAESTPGLVGLDTIAEVARLHAVDAVRAEAVTAVGRATQGRGEHLDRALLRSLMHDGSGRVRYAAMQSIRLMAALGSDVRRVVAACDIDPDFGTEFERSLVIGADADHRASALPPVFGLKGR
ncbi:MAG: glycosyltransferase [Pseudonocardiaceae bacterium]